MKSIVKSKSPVAFEVWKKTNEAVPQNLQYANLDAATKQSIKESLLEN